ncbi:hypothetical protein BSL78_26917 [Apostichopus japonicus]|uniref:Uncharacterized protein n=1 Tax=Stichopus japonicus TaxID=307972 RepID=A0A2G8JKJ3_STIJA|nr:hypothetical protein BSL78_26917 [Apostichopus japonicus]
MHSSILKSSKSKAKDKRHQSPESDSSSSSSYSSSGESSSEDSEEEVRITVKKPKLDSATKKQKRKEQKRQEKKNKMKATNKISKDDYYSKNVEFRLWLMEEKKLAMGDMKTTKAKSYFKKFVKRWNDGKLAKKYYKGIDAADAKGSLTKYKWKFAEKLQGSDINKPSSSSNSPFVEGEKSARQSTFSTFGKASSPTIGPEKRVLGPERPPHLMLQQDSDEDRETERKRVRTERKKYREYDKLTMEELTPKATGHEAKVEKKMLRKHRASSPELSDRVLMGSGMDIETIMAKKRKSDAAKRERNVTKASVKLKEYQAKESAKMKALFEISKANRSKDALW